jgi:hypothetical protein
MENIPYSRAAIAQASAKMRYDDDDIDHSRVLSAV